MKPLGNQIDRLPFAIGRERVVEQYDGPLLVLYRNQAGDPYLEKWMDREGELERWLLFRLSELQFTGFECLRVRLRKLVLECPDRYAFVLDRVKGEIVRTAIVAIAEIPPEFVPGKNSLHDTDLNPKFESPPNEQYFFLSGNWEPRQFAELDRKFRQSYSFLGAFGEKRTGRQPLLKAYLERQKFEAGWNYKSAFDHLESALPANDVARMNRVQYASPGFLKFSVNGEIAESLRSVAHLLVMDPDIDQKYTVAHRHVLALRHSLEEHGASDQLSLLSGPQSTRFDRIVEDASDEGDVQGLSTLAALRTRLKQSLEPDAATVAAPPQLTEVEQQAKLSLESLSDALKVVDFKTVLETVGSVYIAGELLVTFFRRVTELLEFELSSEAEYAGLYRAEDVQAMLEIDDEVEAEERETRQKFRAEFVAHPDVTAHKWDAVQVYQYKGAPGLWKIVVAAAFSISHAGGWHGLQAEVPFDSAKGDPLARIPALARLLANQLEEKQKRANLGPRTVTHPLVLELPEEE